MRIPEPGARAWALAALLGLPAAAVGCGDDGPGSGEGGTGTGTAGDETAGSDGASGDGLDESSTGEPVQFCEGATELIYDPLAGGLDAFPDDFYTVDEDTPTGIRVDMRLGENVMLGGTANSFSTVFEQGSTLDGWGTTSGAYFRLTDGVDVATLPPTPNFEPGAGGSLVVIDIDAGTLVPIEYEVVPEEPGNTAASIIARPLRPLAPTTRYALALTTGATDGSGDCIAPSAAMRDLLSAATADPALDRLAGRIADATAALQGAGVIDVVEDLSGLIVFTTQHVLEDDIAIAGAIAETSPTYLGIDTCTDPDAAAAYLICEGSFEAQDYTDADGVVHPSHESQGTYTIPLTVYLPKTGTPPYSTFLYGHGLGGTRDQAEALAEFAAPEELAVVTLPAPRHGEHPDTSSFNDVLDFFGLSLDLNDPLDALALRDNFRQAAYDKLQLLRLIRAGIDADGDGTDDLDGDSVHYLGVSLGGIMGPEFLALAPEVKTGTLIVPGARVTSIIKEGEDFSVVIDIFAGMATDGEIARFFPIVQGVIDRGDPAVYAPHVVAQRLTGFDGATPQVLMQMVIGDSTVPNVTNAYFARSLQVPHVGPVLLDVGAAELGELPTSENFNGVTAGMFQFDIIDVDGGPETEMATHGNVARSLVAQTQILHFLNTFLDTGVAELLDPYVETGLK